MLKLKYLFNNEDLAEMLVRNWECDGQSPDVFTTYRISSNATYSFHFNGKTQFLRFAPTSEKYLENLLAELDFISYLRSKEYGVLEAVESKSGEKLVEVQTPWGEYYATVFKQVPGVPISETDLNNHIIFTYGKSLGKLHRLSSEYHPVQSDRWSYCDILTSIETILMDLPHETLAIKETKLLQEYFKSIPRLKSNFGLIHYDFEYDNVFYDAQSQSCYVIDFDDAMYHWYVMDIERTLDSLQDCILPELFQEKKECFLDGYRTEFEIQDDMMALLPAFKRFADLYGYVRILKSTEDQWNHEPEWLVGLRGRLMEALKNKSRYFGMNL
ncbi:phosphotransferase enzyme family protein [Rossellomorea sp. KS-H15a]|uniref:phosphotransferase enzyme family protein n=1 Tax=Rossellomorea sp. KS-H15a TaxID=2963940 RepID=UPI0020C6CBCE|nr:phosphotransferase [Rossellomorea sp. KS-H15a]UTE76655.1 phosphotransferase [Rossellomorea sp. KS-H15a]